MNQITKNIFWGLLFSIPSCVTFAANSAYMDKINQVTDKTKSDLHTKYDLPSIGQYLSGSAGSAPSTPTAPATSTGSTLPSTMPEAPTPSGQAPSSTSGGSWYVQPGDTGSGSTGAGSSGSGSSGTGFDHSNIY